MYYTETCSHTEDIRRVTGEDDNWIWCEGIQFRENRYCEGNVRCKIGVSGIRENVSARWMEKMCECIIDDVALEASVEMQEKLWICSKGGIGNKWGIESFIQYCVLPTAYNAHPSLYIAVFSCYESLK